MPNGKEFRGPLGDAWRSGTQYVHVTLVSLASQYGLQPMELLQDDLLERAAQDEQLLSAIYNLALKPRIQTKLGQPPPGLLSSLGANVQGLAGLAAEEFLASDDRAQYQDWRSQRIAFSQYTPV